MNKSLGLTLLCAFCVGRASAGGETRDAAEMRVELPPFLVQDHQSARWLHGDFPNLEVLSSCDWEITNGFVRRFFRTKAEFSALVPEEFRGDIPELMILVPPAQERSIAKEMNRLMQDVSSTSRTILHLRASEEDESAMYFVVNPDFKTAALGSFPKTGLPPWPSTSADDGEPDYLRFRLSADYIRDRLNSRQPALLPCLVSGLTDIFEAVAETEQGLFSPPDTLLTTEDWRAVRFDAEAPRPLLPIEELLKGPPLVEKDIRYRRLWRAESELFVRWALFGREGNGAEKFWKFARESARQGVSESLFKSCFGLDYADCRDALSDYLPLATRKPVNWSAPVPEVSKLWFRSAKSGEIDWIKGEWNRLILPSVKRDFPTMLPVYQQQALTVLSRAQEHTVDKARTLSSLGLLRVKMGEKEEAMKALDEAAVAGSKRPLVLTELARLRLDYYLRKKREPDPKLTEDEATKVLSLLNLARKSSPRIQGRGSVAQTLFQHLNRLPTPEERRLWEDEK